ncbi:unnamed protein product [Bursaphelenchus xylophilus]|uniref:(pine wood nematode) hypothetical protein n=1 Tax=Bursaphelenchus xylophilus TaxID=6326 RepID=A0A7I8X9M9_BURXY|nr:unnamed protein product [Bursaphelenchus xylophilus]CAG9132125.1 unnamed protein product [Bursaphelenchus xylophilus]
MTTITLYNGVEMPTVGLGALQSSPEECLNAIHAALDAGYTLIDTASISKNEEDIGKALEAYFETGKLSRKDVFITTRFWFLQVRPEDVEKTLLEKLKALRTDYVDLYVTHQPKEAVKPITYGARPEHTWKAMEEVYKKGLAKSIGGSNLSRSIIGKIVKAGEVPAHILQFDWEFFYKAPQAAAFSIGLGVPVTLDVAHESPEMKKVVHQKEF